MRYRNNLSLVACLGLSLLAGCSTTNQTVVQTPLGAAELKTNSDGRVNVQVGDQVSVNLDGLKDAKIVGFLSAGNKKALLTWGSSNVCKNRYDLVTITETQAQSSTIGNCGETYVFGGDGSNVFMTQIGVDDPKIWTFVDGKLNGPILRSEMFPAPTKPVLRRRWTRKIVKH